MTPAEQIREFLARDGRRGRALVQLRDSGVSPVACIKALRDVIGLSPEETKRLLARLLSAPPGIAFGETLDEALDAACRLPLDLKTHRHVSPVELVAAAGYQEWATAITERDVAARLDPELLNAWRLYSYDQRCTPAWYLTTSDDHDSPGARWFVGWMPREGPAPPEEPFPSRLDATAAFAKRTLDAIARLR